MRCEYSVLDLVSCLIGIVPGNFVFGFAFWTGRVFGEGPRGIFQGRISTGAIFRGFCWFGECGVVLFFVLSSCASRMDAPFCTSGMSCICGGFLGAFGLACAFPGWRYYIVCPWVVLSLFCGSFWDRHVLGGVQKKGVGLLRDGVSIVTFLELLGMDYGGLRFGLFSAPVCFIWGACGI